MSLTVKQLAKISGVSARTLRFYDQIGLLKPAFYGSNKYRYYGEDQLLILQQILFYRELGFSLSEIQKIICSHDFDKLEALHEHKTALLNNLTKTKALLKTIDKTIAHIRGKIIMSDIEIYEGFNANKQSEYEEYLISKGGLTQKEIDASWKKVSNWQKRDWEVHQEEGNAINEALVIAMKAGLSPSSEKVQEIIERHYNWVKKFWIPTQESYIGLSQMYLEHKDFKYFYENIHPKLLNFLTEAMTIYANKILD
ncbi:transcriptional regulator SkgA, mercury resistanc [Legionella busanensis]|uniref:Transcriptional regulator SkgA, mercury resistanc n=1 Tax=Legionella busanensis TaxID=190655 RepID=A0A378JJ91_9GAMM|nr:MerR family transcriptional regulator [Legionella busanensis]STX51234.1 transcriptional regulator SkgA, mercury resistanc [Legionella busanensis]